MDWRKLVSTTGVNLRGRMVHWQQVEGDAGQLLKQHFSAYAQQRQLERALNIIDSIRAHTGLHGMNSDRTGMLSRKKNYLQVLCSDSRVVPSVETGEHSIISIAFAGESLGGGVSYKQIVDLLPSLDGIIIQGHTNCGACAAANKAREGTVFDGSLQDLTSNVEGDIVENMKCQVRHVIERVGKELLKQHQVAVFAVQNDIFAEPRKSKTILEETLEFNDLSLPKIREAVDVYRRILAQARDPKHTPAPQHQHPSVLWLSGLTIYSQFRRGIGSEHEMVDEFRKGVIFKVLWQNPHDPCAVASARYILEHGDHVKQLIFTATSERDLWWDIETFVNNPELSKYLLKNVGTQLIGIIVDDNGVSATDRVVRLEAVE
ncbi:MAG: hypothetical protein WCP97_06385 [bacterium]